MRTADRKRPPAGRGNRDSLRRRAEKLAARLAEAEETISALRSGAVDAMVVSTPSEGNRVYTLRGAERAYRVFLEAMGEGALTVTREGLILYANRRFAEIAGRPLEKVIGESLFFLAAPGERRVLEALLTPGTSGERRSEVSLRTGEGKAVPVSVSAIPLPESDPPAFCLVTTDLTEWKKAEAELTRHRRHLEELVSERTSELVEANARVEGLLAREREARVEAEEKSGILDTLMEHVPEGIAVADAKMNFLMVSRYGRALAGREGKGLLREKAGGHARAWGIYRSDGKALAAGKDRLLYRAIRYGESARDRELVMGRPGGPKVPILANAGPIRNAEGRIVGGVMVWRDITARKRMEETLRASLEAKDLLMRELAHRTKNNMQVIANLLGLQASASADEKLIRAFSDAQDRIRAMALVHEKLYRSVNVSSVDMREYARDFLASLLRTHQETSGPVKPVLDLGDVSLSIDAALPCGMILNELVSNSLKHAFPDGKAGSIFLSLRRRNDEVLLTYSDDGPGLPRDMNLSRIGSLGLKLVHNLAVRQLRGTMHLRDGPGAQFLVRFRDLPPAKST